MQLVEALGLARLEPIERRRAAREPVGLLAIDLPAGFRRLVDEHRRKPGGDQRSRGANAGGTGAVDYVPAASDTDATAAMFAPGEALDYYLNPRRGRVPTWGARFAVMAWSQWLTFDPIALADRVRTPVRIVTSEGSATPGGAVSCCTCERRRRSRRRLAFESMAA